MPEQFLKCVDFFVQLCHFVEVFKHKKFHVVGHVCASTGGRGGYLIPYHYLCGESESYMQIEFETWHETP